MKRTIGAVLTAVVAIAAIAVGISTITNAAPLSAGAAAAGTSTLSPTSGIQSTSFTLTPPTGAACPGDSSSGGYRFSTFIASRDVDLAVLTFNASGPIDPDTSGPKTVAPLYNTGGSPQVNKTTGTGTGALAGLATLNFATNVPVANGQYNIGYSCTLSGATEKYWSTPITISSSTATTLAYAFGWAPDAPTLASPLTAGDGTLAGSFTAATMPSGNPAVSGYTVTYTPSGGSALTTTLGSGATTFTLTGLTNGTQYAVTVAATNSVGTGSASNSVNGTPNPSAYAAPTSFAVVPGAAGACDASWAAPAGDSGRTGYSLTVTGGAISGGSSPFTVASGDVSKSVTGLTAGTAYTFQLVATYTSPYSGTATGSVVCTPLAAQVLNQDITVVRPAGALVLTQRCGVYGALDAESASSAFPVDLSALSASTDTVGTAPSYGGGADPLFGDYPYDGSYPTTCGVDLGNATLLQSGSLAGSYFAASGRLPQITVVNTSDTDTGWSITASMGDFTKSGGGSFSGNYLGWSPKVTSDSAANFEGYDMVVTAGSNVDPATSSSLGSTPSKTLASSASGSSLGLARIDARLKLLVPVSATSGTYSGTLTLTVL